MPHKHKRRQKDDSNYDLPPTSIAKPLPVRENNAGSKKTNQTKKGKVRTTHKNASTYQDDTPRDFARMMARMAPSDALAKPPPSNPEDSKQHSRKRKRSEPDDTSNKPKATDGPKILPGERMSDFSARVNQELPLAGVSRKAGDSTKNSKDAALRNLRETRQTKHERKLRRLQEEWRKDEQRIREKEAEEREEQEEKDEEMNDLWKVWEAEAGGSMGKGKKNGKTGAGKKNKKGKNGAVIDGDEDDGDPWAKLNRKARASRAANPFDVAQAPPESLVKPKEKFKVRGMGGAKVDVADVPAAAGSLRRREELATERKSIVERYRKLMAEKNG